MASDAAAPLRYLHLPATQSAALDSLSPQIAAWFSHSFPQPTLAQRFAWPAVARGEHVLLAAPTGKGKTLAAFAPILSRMMTEGDGHGTCLYVAPLKALVRDAKKNLKRHLVEVADLHGLDAIDISVGVRTGDTSDRARRKMWDEPPRILLTTPESLATMLTHARAIGLFRFVRWVVIDELHALAVSKRGADLALSLERLEAMAESPPQRIGLSATCLPLARAAVYLVGPQRSCTVAQADDETPLELTIEPLPPGDDDVQAGFMRRLLDRLHPELTQRRTTLIFSNVRSMAERIVWALKRRYPEQAELIAPHHSSLSAAVRRQTERLMKQGKLWAVVSSASLELGIDIGSVQQVIFIHPPGSVVRLLQRVGRSGRTPGEPRRGLVLAAHPSELLESAATAICSRMGQLESLAIPEAPLDVLCQHLVGMAMERPWTREEALEVVRRAGPYANLSEEDFDACLRYLSGASAERSDWLPARLRWSADSFSIASPAVARLMRRNMGTIIDDQPCQVRIVRNEDEPTLLIGELDDVFASRLQEGDRFLLGGRCLEFQSRRGRTFLAREAMVGPATPTWTSGPMSLAPELAERLFLFRSQAAEAARHGEASLTAWLSAEAELGPAAAAELARFLALQEAVSEVPDLGSVLIEQVDRGMGTEVAMHLPLPRPAIEAILQLVDERLRRDGHRTLQTLVVDLGLLFFVDGDPRRHAFDWARLLDPTNAEEELRRLLEDHPLLRERFAAVSRIGLMVLRNPIGGRRVVGGRDWEERRLFEEVRAVDPDFPLVRQARRETSTDVCDVATALRWLRRMPQLAIRQRWLADSSPFAEAWLAGMTQPRDVAEARA
ncbi:MAG: DEAD/DEAH box helicase [Gemmataceae bacterium]|nr:DEAD/DEAH box helicase [Gemmataceae bacterium]